MTYNCVYHGFVRKIMSPTQSCDITDEEFFRKIKSGEIKIKPYIPSGIRTKPRPIFFKGINKCD